MVSSQRQPYSEAARANMVSQQIATNNVVNTRIVKALEAVPRELFVPAELKHLAYIDDDIPLNSSQKGVERFIIEPMVLARMLELTDMSYKSKVLNVGCTTGYSAAVISHIAQTVHALEADELLAARANNNLQELRSRNVQIAIGALDEGFASAAPYDVIVINGGGAFVPPAIEAQLKEGGRIAFVQTDSSESALGRVMLGLKHQGVVSYRGYYDTAARHLPGFTQPETFAF